MNEKLKVGKLLSISAYFEWLKCWCVAERKTGKIRSKICLTWKLEGSANILQSRQVEENFRTSQNNIAEDKCGRESVKICAERKHHTQNFNKPFFESLKGDNKSAHNHRWQQEIVTRLSEKISKMRTNQYFMVKLCKEKEILTFSSSLTSHPYPESSP